MFDPAIIAKSAGLLGIFAVIFTESGLLIGLFLPGDTLIFASSIFASQGLFSIQLLILSVIVSTFLGYMVGYWTGKKFGRKLFNREDSLFFNKKKLETAEKFYKKYGPMAIVIARFIPFVRTFAPMVAGVAHMPYRTFLFYNTLGSIVWVTPIALIGYYFGSLIPNIDFYIAIVFSFVIFCSFVPFLVKVARSLLKKKS